MGITWSHCSVAVVLLTFVLVLPRRLRRRFHPGPAGVPVLGNIFDVPKSHPWLVYQRWSKKYSTSVIIIFNHLEARRLN